MSFDEIRAAQAKVLIVLVLLSLDQCALENQEDPCEAGISFVEQLVIADDIQSMQYSLFGRVGDPILYQSFQISGTGLFKVSPVQVYLDKVGSPGDKIKAALCTDEDEVVEISETENTITGPGWYSFEFANYHNKGTLYYIKVYRSGSPDSSNYYKWHYETNNPYAGGEWGVFVGGEWTPISNLDGLTKIDVYNVEDAPCYYTWNTCRDLAHYSKTTVVHKFTLREGPLFEDCLPYLASWKNVPVEIRDKEHTTRRQKVTFKLHDDLYHPVAVPNKTTSPLETAGTFFKNLLARNSYYEGRYAEVKVGYEGLDESEFKTVFKGRLTGWDNKEGAATIEAKDLTEALDVKLPVKISDENVLTQTYSGGADMYWTIISEFPDQGTVQLENEYVTWTGVDAVNGKLTGCTAGAFGTTPATHVAGTGGTVLEVFTNASSLSVGILGGEALLKMFYRGGLDMLQVATRDLSLTLTLGIDDDDPAIPVTGEIGQLWEGGGCVRIGAELIRFSAISGSNLTVSERGAYGTTAASHSADDPILYMEPDFEFHRWLTGTLWKRVYEEPMTVSQMLDEFRESTGLRVWQGEDCMVHAKLMAPPFYDESPAEWTDEANIKDGTPLWKDGAATRVTRGVIHYNPSNNKPGRKRENYQQGTTEIDCDQEHPNAHGRVELVELFAPWAYRELEALSVISRYVIRYGPGAGTFKCRVGEKDAGVGVGDFVKVTSKEMVDPDGAPRDKVLFEVLIKTHVGHGNYEITMIDTRLDKKFCVIGPADQHDWEQRTEEEEYELGCGWIGDADNKLDDDDGYYIY